MAARNGHVDTLRVLVEECKANANSVDWVSPLMEATREGHMDCVRFLALEAKVLVNERDQVRGSLVSGCTSIPCPLLLLLLEFSHFTFVASPPSRVPRPLVLYLRHHLASMRVRACGACS